MSRIVFAWELGANHGHLWMLLPLAERLREQGHEVVFGLRAMPSAQRYLAPRGIRWFAAPMPHDGIFSIGREIASYADILAVNGAAYPDLLGGMVSAWQHLFSALQADLVVAEHAPFAQLAAKCAGLPTVQLGTGFTIPPVLSPAPCFRPWLAGDAAAQRQTQQAVEHTVQTVAGRQESLDTLFTADHTRLLGIAELDHYGPLRQDDAVFIGALPQPVQGEAVAWEQAGRPHVFVYLTVQPRLEAVLDTLEASEVEVIAVIHDLPAQLAARYRKLRLYRQPVQLLPLLSECTLAITHAGHGTAMNCLLAGVSLLLLPQHIEQLMVAERVAATGAGIGILPSHVQDNFPSVLQDMLYEPKYTAAACAIAARYAQASREQALEELAGLIGLLR